jgi:hypothetical protein
MVSKGSHEINNHYWSYDLGPAHVIAFSTEFHYYTELGERRIKNHFTKNDTKQIRTQYKWLERDLIEANKPKNRSLRPWIITMGHRPLYNQKFIDENVGIF